MSGGVLFQEASVSCFRRFPSLRWLLALPLLLGVRPAHALPKFSREYGVGCNTCHSVAPRLNEFGLAFQANHFNWPGEGMKKRVSLKAFPVSGILHSSVEVNHTEGKTTTAFRELELFVSDGFPLGKGRQGGYFLNTVAVTTGEGERAGGIQNAFVALPFAGKRGQWAVTLGQLTPIMYQYDPVNSLVESTPFTFSDPVDEFSFTEAAPGFRIDFFDHRGGTSANGTYVDAGVPFEGGLAFNSDAAVHSARGVYAHAFRRWGWTSLGVIGFTHAGNHLAGLIGTHRLGRNLYLLGTAALGQDEEGTTKRLSVEAEYTAGSRLALTGRLEARQGHDDDIAPVAAITYYPFKPQLLRLTAEARQRKGDRAFFLFARGQF
jgi:hypothetical protein